MEACNAIITRPATRWARRRFHHRARNQPDVRRAGRRGAGRCWTRAGRPADAIYAELGPGRGTLAADALRVMRRAGFRGRSAFRRDQPGASRRRRRTPSRKPSSTTHRRPSASAAAARRQRILRRAAGPQWVGDEQRRSDGGRFAFTATARSAKPRRRARPPPNALAKHLARHGGAAIVIDYGYAGGEQGDTLQAVRGHASPMCSTIRASRI
jgi:NADH dehydrogenase [ubiquinone] 1 alpha subcomplex assembly factor 7